MGKQRLRKEGTSPKPTVSSFVELHHLKLRFRALWRSSWLQRKEHRAECLACGYSVLCYLMPQRQTFVSLLSNFIILRMRALYHGLKGPQVGMQMVSYMHQLAHSWLPHLALRRNHTHWHSSSPLCLTPPTRLPRCVWPLARKLVPYCLQQKVFHAHKLSALLSLLSNTYRV